KLRRLYAQVLRPRFLYDCSKNKNLFYDLKWKGLSAGEFRPVNTFLSLEEMKAKEVHEKKKLQTTEIRIDTSIAGGYDPSAGKDRYYQLDCINALLDGFRNGTDRMLVHMATGLGKTRTTVALCKALLSHGLAKRILFVVDRRILAKQAKDDGFTLISPDYLTEWITTSNYKQHRIKDIHIVVIDTLEIIHKQISSSFYDLIVVDECHRSMTINRKVIFDHFLCPRIGLTATPREALKKQGTHVTDDDLAILDTYRMFGCEVGKPTYEFDLEHGIKEEFLAPYKKEEIKTHLTQVAEKEGIEFDYVLDPDERKKIELDQTKRLKLEQLNRKYLTENTAKRIAEEIKKHTDYGEKMILFGVSQAHCIMLANAINQVFHDTSDFGTRYAESIISDNSDLNDTLKRWFKEPNRKPYITLSVDIMSTGVDIPCVRYIGFAALTKSVGKYIQMIGRGTRLDPKSGKFSFTVLDFVGLMKKMQDNGMGSPKKNKRLVTGTGGGAGPTPPPGGYFIVDNPDPEKLIQRVFIKEDGVRIIDNIPIEEAREIFEREVNLSENEIIQKMKQKARMVDYQPSESDISALKEWTKNPIIFLNEGDLQKIYDYPQGSIWDFILHVMKIKKIPTPKERIENGYESYITTYVFTDEQLDILNKIKDTFVSNIAEGGDFDLSQIFSVPMYERIIGNYEEINQVFDGNFDAVVDEMKESFQSVTI
ncbi:MAG: DEAD/DEAH box helicase family protein, partial [Candidatus Marinimicrobia bacterium]|nr:DEAD/DEAH box helicase family protein [Candidatus Neomarinimicrobiota bacterium]